MKLERHQRPDENPMAMLFKQPLRSSVLLCWTVCIVTLLSPHTLAASQTISGQVTNATTGQRSAGDYVVLYRIDQTMHDQAHTISDRYGAFRFENVDGMRHLIAVFHQGVSYHTQATIKPDPVGVTVYDATYEVRDIREDSDTLFFEGRAGSLTVTQFFVVSNDSAPPRTLFGSNTFDFELPSRATIDSVAVQPPGTLPLRTEAFALGANHRFALHYPIRPGTTKIRVVYHLPYSGSTSVRIPVRRQLAAMAVMVPTSMRLAAEPRNLFTRRSGENNLSAYVAKDLRPGSTVTLVLQGSGTLTSISTVAKKTTTQPWSPSALGLSITDLDAVTASKRESETSKGHISIFAHGIFISLAAFLIGIAVLKQKRRFAVSGDAYVAPAVTRLD